MRLSGTQNFMLCGVHLHLLSLLDSVHSNKTTKRGLQKRRNTPQSLKFFISSCGIESKEQKIHFLTLKAENLVFGTTG